MGTLYLSKVKRERPLMASLAAVNPFLKRGGSVESSKVMENLTNDKVASQEVSHSAFPKLAHYSAIELELKALSGKILTIIDGAITNERQNKAIKDQVRKEIRELIFIYQGLCSNNSASHSVEL